MIRVAITVEAFDAVAATLALGTVAVEPERAQDGSLHIWLDPRVLAKLKVLRSPGESYSDVIADWPRTLRNPAVERSRRNGKRPPLADIPASALLVIYATPKESAECPQA
jgi:hypothetical protein